MELPELKMESSGLAIPTLHQGRGHAEEPRPAVRRLDYQLAGAGCGFGALLLGSAATEVVIDAGVLNPESTVKGEPNGENVF